MPAGPGGPTDRIEDRLKEKEKKDFLPCKPGAPGRPGKPLSPF